jgi:PEGA domain
MPTGVILAYSIPDGAIVLIDGYTASTIFGVAITPAIIHEVTAGAHNVTFRATGYIEETKTVTVRQGGYTSVTAILHPGK